MSAGQIEQFYSRVSKDPAIFNKLMAGTETPDEFIDKAVAIGTETGFSFTRDEADTWIKGQIAAKANGELSDLQLEGVAGGKGGSSAVNTIINASPADYANAFANTARRVHSTVATWFSSW